jgi:O-antigen/teichoic acid export membrane protein
MLLYGLGCIFSGLGSAFITKLDLMMLPAFTDLSQTGVYTIAIFFTTVMEVPKKSLNQIALPIFIKADAASNADEIRGLYQKTSFLGFFTTASLLLLVWVNLDSIFAIMPKGAYYQSGSIVILLLGAAKVVDASGGIGLEMMSFSKHFRFLIIAIFAVGIFAAIGNYLLIPSYGIHGAAIASLVVYSVFLLVRTLYIYRHYSILPFSKSMLLSLVPLSIAFLVSYILVLLTSNFHPLLRLAAHSLVAFSILLGGVYVLRISPEINAIADKAVAILKSKRIS